MPGQAPAVTDERELLVGHLAQQQDGFRNAMHGLTDEEAGRAAVATTTLPVGTLAKHVTQVQQDWLDLVRAAPGEEVPARGPQAAGAARQAAWTWTDDDTVASVPAPPAPWNPREDESWSARWRRSA